MNTNMTWFSKICVCMLRTKVASALEGLALSFGLHTWCGSFSHLSSISKNEGGLRINFQSEILQNLTSYVIHICFNYVCATRCEGALLHLV